MKKIVACLTVALFLVMIPIMSSAKKPLTEKEMDATTAQEGVSIEFGGASAGLSHFVVGFDPPDVQSWGEADGCSTCGGYTNSGWVGMRDMTMSAAANIILYNTMTIDVGTSGSTTKTFINPGTVIVHPVGTIATVAMGTDQTLAGTQILGRVYNDKFAVVVNPFLYGYMSIGNHSATGSGEGVEIGFSSSQALPGLYGAIYPRAMGFAIPDSRIDVSCGDMDGDQSGATGYTSAGYFGARNMYMESPAEGTEGNNNFFILVSGTLDIDVGSNGGKTAVVIGLPTVTIPLMDPSNTYQQGITQPLVFATSRDLDTNTQALGTLYTGGISISPSGSLTISAH
jgi:hypothetical protein